MKGNTGREGIIGSKGGTAGLAVLAALLAVGAHDSRAAPVGGATLKTAQASVAGLPLNFEANVGQARSGAQFLAHGPAYSVSLNSDGATLASDGNTLRLHVVGSRDGVAPVAEQPLPGVVNYYVGNDPKIWLTGIKTYARVRYAGVYPGVDLLYYGTQGRLEYDIAVAPGASAKPVRIAIEGAERVRLDRGGRLTVQANLHEVAFEHPVAYQVNEGRRVPVAARYRLAGNTVRFELGAYDHSKQLIIDPVLSYFSYLGGSNNDVIGTGSPSGSTPNVNVTSQAAALDAAGDLYVVGYTQSSNFPTKAAYQQDQSPGTQPTGFVTKFAADGKSLIFSTYLGGTNGFDYAYAVAVDSSGNAFVVGSAASNDFPITPGAYQTVCSPNFNNNVTTANCSDPSNNGQVSSYVSKFSPSGSLLASTFLGGEGAGMAYAVAVDSSGRPYVAGTTYPGVFTPAASFQAKTIGFPTTTGAVVSAYTFCQGCNINGSLQYDAFVSVLDPTLTTLVYSTLYGNDQGFTVGANLGSTYGTAVTVDASGNFYLAGYTADAYLPVTGGAVQPLITSCGQYFPNQSVVNGNCGFVAKFSPVGGGSAPTQIYGTYLGHLPGCCSSNYISGIAADSAGDAFVVGYASVATFPTTSGAYQTTCDQYPTVNDTNCSSAFIAKLNPNGTALLASTYFGGLYAGANGISDNVASVGGIALDKSDNVYIVGTASTGLPQVNGFSVTAGSIFPFVAELDSSLSSLLFSTLINDGAVGQVNVDGLALDTAGNIYIAGSIIPGTSVATSGAFQASNGGGSSDGFVAKISVVTATTTTLTASPTTATAGTAINFTATVAESGGSSVPTGTVTFKDGSTTLGSMTLNGTGVAVFSTSTLAAGAHSITAAYGGDAANTASTSTATSVTVNALPAPTVTIAVAPTSIVLGTSATLTWSSTNASACTASNGWTGSEAVTGTQSVTPSAAGSVSYVLTCTGSGGSGNATAMLTVTSPAPTVTIAVSPTSITVGQSATLTWSSTNATSCTASGAWSGSEATSGTMSASPTTAATDSYVLACTGTGGTASGTATLTVAAAVVPPPTPPAPSKSGGGALGLWELLGLFGFIAIANRRKRAGAQMAG
jgi:Bacterial Ig-like domain (group 3)/Beta-propeller repeat